MRSHALNRKIHRVWKESKPHSWTFERAESIAGCRDQCRIHDASFERRRCTLSAEQCIDVPL